MRQYWYSCYSVPGKVTEYYLFFGERLIGIFLFVLIAFMRSDK